MSYGPRLIIAKTGVVATTTYVIADELGGWPAKGIFESANFFVQSANTTGEWDVEMQWRAPGSSDVMIIATSVGGAEITANTLTQINLHANVTGLNESIPFPTHFVLTEFMAGGIDFELWVMFA